MLDAMEAGDAEGVRQHAAMLATMMQNAREYGARDMLSRIAGR
jgi:hypothetical protein